MIISKVAVVGGAGFVGQALAEELRSAGIVFEIYDIADASSGTATFYDVTSPDINDELAGCTTLINLAAEHRDDVLPTSKYYEVNVEGAKKICDDARRHSINQIIFTSSVAIYGFAEPGTAEDGPVNYFNEYGRTKYLAEQVYLSWQRESPDTRSLTILRPTVIFGEGNRGNVYNLCKQIAAHRFLMVGDGKNIKSMAYVKNVAAFLSFAVKFQAGIHVYNYIDKPDLNMNELIFLIRKQLFNRSGVGVRMPTILGLAIGLFFDAISKILRKPLPVSSLRVKKFVATTRFNSAIASTGFRPPYALRESLIKTLEHEFGELHNNDPK